MSSRLCLFLLSAVAAFTLLLPASHAQNTANLPRIVAPVDDSALITLKGGVPGRARPQFDRGRAQTSAQLTSVRLVLSRTPQQEAALEKFMAGQIDPSSPNYHHWLTPQQFGQLYGPSDADIQTLVTWLQSQGFTVRPVAPGRLSIAFSGSVAQMEAAFHTEIHTFNANGEEFLSNVRNPSIPAAFASVVSGIAHLDTIQPRPLNVPGRLGTYDREKKRFTAVDDSGVRPELTISGGSSESLYLVPGDAATIYNTPNLLNSNFDINGTQVQGSGVVIGIGGDAVINPDTVTNYFTQFGGGGNNVPVVTNVDNTASSSDDADEAYLDTEIAGGLARDAIIHFYTAGNLNNAIEQAINDNTVDIFSLSFGACEADLTTADNATINGWWQQAAAQGIAVTVSSGDSGASGCDNDNTEEVARYGLQVSGFASTPYNIAVGGTDFIGLQQSFSTYAGTTNGSFYQSALKYIPESTWNDSTNENGLLAQNTPAVDSKTGKTNIVGGGGGASSCSTNTNTGSLSGCTSGYAKPSWQRGAGVPSDGVRDIPDVSLMAGNGAYNAAWLVCTDDTGTVNGVKITANCAMQSDGSFYFTGYGGTSTSAPAFAGILALVQSAQPHAVRLGMGAAKTLYDIYNGSSASAVFHDITQGNISVPCTAGTPNCSKNSAGSYFVTGYDTTAGYDLATGLGSVDVTQLIQNWPSSTGSATATVNINTAIPSNMTVADSLTIPVTVTGSSATPTGTVRVNIFQGSTLIVSGAPQTLANGSATISLPAYTLPEGVDTIAVIYSGDTTYSPAEAGPDVVVSSLSTTITATPSATTVADSSSFTLKVTVAGPSGAPIPTGTVYLNTSQSFNISAQALSNGSYIFTIPANSLTAGSVTLYAVYSGDGVYNSNSVNTNITVTAAPTFTVAGVNPSAIARGASATSAITITGSNGYAGTVGLTCALTSSPSGAKDLPTCSFGSSTSVTLSSSTTSATATLTLNTTAASQDVSARTPASPWSRAGAGALLALLSFLGIPARSRVRRTMLGIVLLAALVGFSACGGGSTGTGGGGSTGGGGGSQSNPGTTAGTYTFTITGTGNPAITPAPTTTVTLTVN